MAAVLKTRYTRLHDPLQSRDAPRGPFRQGSPAQASRDRPGKRHARARRGRKRMAARLAVAIGHRRGSRGVRRPGDPVPLRRTERSVRGCRRGGGRGVSTGRARCHRRGLGPRHGEGAVRSRSGTRARRSASSRASRARSPVPGPCVPWIAVPTTSGTGAEATKNAVVKAEAAGVKRSMRSRHLLAQAVLVDPELTLSLPPGVTGTSGLDAFTQLIEAYVSRASTPPVRSLIEGAFPPMWEALDGLAGVPAGCRASRKGQLWRVRERRRACQRGPWRGARVCRRRRRDVRRAPRSCLRGISAARSGRKP